MKHRPPTAMLSPRCVDCGETDRRKFYAHPKSKTGCQRRCKVCDNALRCKNQRKGRDVHLHKLELIAGVEGMAVYLNGYRIAGPKPWGGGVVRHEWTASGSDLSNALRRAWRPRHDAVSKEAAE